MNIHNFKLKHIEAVQSEQIDYVRLLVEVMGYKNTWFNRHFGINREIKKVALIVREVQNMKPEELVYDTTCKIRYEGVDDIPFIARIELDNLQQKKESENILSLMSNIISIVTYSLNVGRDFDIDSDSFKTYRAKIENTSAIQMIGLYNTIIIDQESSNKLWDERFRAVEVTDEDYDMAGGRRMNQFNIINTVKSICNDFNITYEEAWQMPYVVVQSNGYAKATYAHIEYTMTQLKEQKMKTKRQFK